MANTGRTRIPDDPDELRDVVRELDRRRPLLDLGLVRDNAQRPAAEKHSGRLVFTATGLGGVVGTLYFSDGTEWREVIASDASFGAPAFTLGTANTAGTGSTVVHSDATIAVFNDGAAPENVKASSATGNDAVAARRDHEHGTPMTAKGSLLTRDGSVALDLPVGTDTQVLTADSAQASGLKWAASGAASDVALYIKAFVPTATTTTVPTKHQIVVCEEYGIEGTGILELDGTAMLCIDGVAA
jgi:hypothetical protein